jgi:hypothetical protein
MSEPRLNGNESTVLAILTEQGGEDSECGFLGFKGIEHEMPSLERQAIRRACRSLARKGLARYAKGLWTDDGRPGGSGYAATKAGMALREQIEGRTDTIEAQSTLTKGE